MPHLEGPDPVGGAHLAGGPDGLAWLTRRQDTAVTVYAVTDAVNTSAAKAFRAADQAVGAALARAANDGVRPEVRDRLRRNWESLAATTPWADKSMAVFLTEGFAVAHPVPDRVRPEVAVGERFVLGQLLRSVAVPFGAYALTLSAERWRLWWGTSTSTAFELPGAGGASELWRRVLADLIDPIEDELLDGYLARVASTVAEELRGRDPSGSRPLLLFAEPGLAAAFEHHLASARGPHRPVEVVPGAADGLSRGPIGRRIRSRSKEHGRERHIGIVERCRPLLLNGLAADQWRHVSAAAASGAVRTLLYDHVTGPDAVAVDVLRTGGEVLPLTGAELTAAGWSGSVLAELRHPVG